MFRPFSDGDSLNAFRGTLGRLLDEIAHIDNSNFLKTSPAELENYYVDRARIDPLILHTDQAHAEQQSTPFEIRRSPDYFVRSGTSRKPVPGTRLTITIPFEGDSKLWKIQPSTYLTGGLP